jgi:hypothetical protein
MDKSDAPKNQGSIAKDANQSKNKTTSGQGVAANPKGAPTTDKPNSSDNPNSPSKMKVWLKTHVTPTLVVELLVLFVGIRVAYIYSGQLDQMILTVKWTQEQVVAFYNTGQRPMIFAKIPNKIHVEVGKPIQPTIELFNYGKVPGIVRARVHFEASEGAIEKFRDMLLFHGSDFLIAPQDDKTILNILILSDKSVPYPIETPPIILAQRDIEKLSSGSIDIAVYGRIFYFDLSNRAYGKPNAMYTTSFCFYFQRDGTASACPNKEGAYTNFAP